MPAGAILWPSVFVDVAVVVVVVVVDVIVVVCF